MIAVHQYTHTLIELDPLPNSQGNILFFPMTNTCRVIQAKHDKKHKASSRWQSHEASCRRY